MTNDNQIEIVKKKADAYLLLGDAVHVSYKNGHWQRGIVTEVSADFFILDDTKDGILPIFFLEIKDIQKYIKKEKKDGTV